ncbi:MAG: GET complex subunit get1 [Lichina confinis]|nr:MAG: GET complex subunit get1 [Lichina confinis]
MSSLLVIVFVAQVIIYLVGSLGGAVVASALWELYNRLPTSTSKAVREQARLRRELVRLRSELSGTSAQHEFARWALLRRQHDRAKDQLDKISTAISSSKGNFESVVSVARWTATSGFRFLLQFWFTKEPIYWLPQGWLPYYVEWILSFPKAPLGGVSIQVWWMACAGATQLAGEVLVGTYKFLSREDEREDETRPRQNKRTATGQKKQQ